MPSLYGQADEDEDEIVWETRSSECKEGEGIVSSCHRSPVLGPLAGEPFILIHNTASRANIIEVSQGALVEKYAT